MLPLAGLGGAAGWFFFFAIFALKIRRNHVFNTVISLFYFLFLFASSMFYPLEPLPAWFRSAALANPMTWQVDFLQFSSIGRGDPLGIVAEATAFVVFSLAAFAYVVRSLPPQEVATLR